MMPGHRRRRRSEVKSASGSEVAAVMWSATVLSTVHLQEKKPTEPHEYYMKALP